MRRIKPDHPKTKVLSVAHQRHSEKGNKNGITRKTHDRLQRRFDRLCKTKLRPGLPELNTRADYSVSLLMNPSIHRRQFVKQTTALSAGLATFGAPAIARSAESPGDKLLVGVMGLGRGLDHCNALL